MADEAKDLEAPNDLEQLCSFWEWALATKAKLERRVEAVSEGTDFFSKMYSAWGEYAASNPWQSSAEELEAFLDHHRATSKQERVERLEEARQELAVEVLHHVTGKSHSTLLKIYQQHQRSLQMKSHSLPDVLSDLLLIVTRNSCDIRSVGPRGARLVSRHAWPTQALGRKLPQNRSRSRGVAPSWTILTSPIRRSPSC